MLWSDLTMTQIDFDFNASNKLEVIRKLVAKASQAGSCVLLYTQDAALLQHVDQYLWAAQTLNFIPHVPCRHPLAEKTPVLIGDDPGSLAKPDVLIILMPKCRRVLSASADCWKSWVRTIHRSVEGSASATTRSAASI